MKKTYKIELVIRCEESSVKYIDQCIEDGMEFTEGEGILLSTIKHIDEAPVPAKVD